MVVGVGDEPAGREKETALLFLLFGEIAAAKTKITKQNNKPKENV